MRRDVAAAASSVVAMMLGAAVFVGVVGTMFYQTQEVGKGPEGRLDAQFLQHKASALSDTLLQSPGYSASGGDWVASAAAVEDAQRLGLRDASNPYLNFSKFENLRLSPYARNATDGYMNYEEAVASLGLDDSGLGFHVRAYPTLRSVRQILEDGHGDRNLKVAYIGAIGASNGGGGGGGGGGASDPPTGLALSNVVCTRSPYDSKVLRMQAQVVNGGTTTTMFHVVFDVLFLSGESQRREDVTLTVAAGGTAAVAVDFATSPGRTCAEVDLADVEVSDTSTSLLWEWTVDPVTVQAPDVASPKSRNLWMHGDNGELYVLAGSAAKLRYDGPGNNDALDIVVRDAAGTTVHQQLDVKSKDLKGKIEVPASALSVGNFTVFLKHRTDGVTVTHQVVVVASGSVPTVYSGGGATTGDLSQWSQAARTEVGLLEQLIEGFCPYYFDDDATTPVTGIDWEGRCGDFRPVPHVSGQVGDVFPHTRKILVDDLRDRLIYPAGHAQEGLADVNTTQVLVVGSTVNHQGMVHVKDEVAQWVEAGGTLIVFGSDDSNTQWMTSIFDIGIHSSNNGISRVNDASHPILHVADDLDYARYESETQYWQFKGNNAHERFTNVIGEATNDGMELGLSNAGAFGRGNLIVTSYFPYDLFREGPSDATEQEGLYFVNNLLMISYRTLYLDYGPEIPEDVPVIPATNKATILHPELGRVTLDLIVYVFPYS